MQFRQPVSSRALRRAVRFSVALVLIVLTAGAAAARAASVGAPAVSGKDAAAQGIRVSGWWKIDVRNPDGTLVKHLEFENAVTPYGASALLNLISVSAIAGGIGIVANDGSTGGACANSGCIMYSSGYGSVQESDLCSKTYVCFTNNFHSTIQSGALTLSGSIIASQDGKLSHVGTTLGTCTSGTPIDCIKSTGAFGPQFTNYTLPTPLSLTSGQIVQFSVAISFS